MRFRLVPLDEKFFDLFSEPARDRRALFFVIAATACLLMVPVRLDEYRPVAIGTAVVYLVFALLSYLDYCGRNR